MRKEEKVTTDRKNSPLAKPESYRQATPEDIVDPEVAGFYYEDGAYWRKKGKPRAGKFRPDLTEVEIRLASPDYSADGWVNDETVHLFFVRIGGPG